MLKAAHELWLLPAHSWVGMLFGGIVIPKRKEDWPASVSWAKDEKKNRDFKACKGMVSSPNFEEFPKQKTLCWQSL